MQVAVTGTGVFCEYGVHGPANRLGRDAKHRDVSFSSDTQHTASSVHTSVLTLSNFRTLPKEALDLKRMHFPTPVSPQSRYAIYQIQ